MKRVQSAKCKVQSFLPGFTFIELLVSMSIILLVGSLILVVFFMSLRGAEKSQHLLTLRQNGNFALTQMVKSVRLAKGFPEGTLCDGTTALPSISIISATDLTITTYACTEAEPGSEFATIASRSASGDETQLLDGSTVKTNGCSFTCGTQGPFQTPYLRINFSLIPAAADPQQSDTSSLPFSSTIILKNAEE
jgi:prepilin-type N-terminal cleavage/methylation domain-containing protein